MKRLLLVVLASCNQFYGLEATDPAEEPVRGDRDGDGVFDDLDNCIDHPNPTQADEDRDTVGNACDNCPLIANADQENLGDRDDVGDKCDPHPVDDGDCLVLFDSFDDDVGFANHWTVVGSASFAHDNGSLVVTAPAEVSLLARDTTGAVLDAFYEVQLTGHFLSSTGALLAVASARDQAHYRCGVRGNPTQALYLQEEQQPTGLLSATVYQLVEQPVGDSVLIRLSITNPSGPLVACELEYGLGLTSVTGNPPHWTGAPGVVVRSSTTRVDGFTAVRFQPGVACVPILR